MLEDKRFGDGEFSVESALINFISSTFFFLLCTLPSFDFAHYLLGN